MTLDASYKHGIIWQDMQHEQLVDNIGKLAAVKATGAENKKKFFAAVKFIKEYTNSHFIIEELYMKKYAYPEIKTHTAVHQYFIDSFDKFIDNSIYSEKEVAKLIDRLNKWLAGHIQTLDKDLAEFLLKTGTM